ncbi:hypothetical protein PPL_12102 [Heterostelium album PN500]|uniref:Uncharacterized protein n=1 Tax=Heterostelium pallidum (strain ATCC 26659 / Pp 5 / PN500) TaxID=670386 RepID=D3BLP9_HETP5|nr:hypothetical protein PPL_12102 [Heterostelium album PN500]EFA77500.1 hypothetical protein PPL_12102 [Heterostelium album PN500]|eukprot:XP_020429628.1 hypothetical protein PPL_12102 [Heterostelium album PN500]
MVDPNEQSTDTTTTTTTTTTNDSTTSTNPTTITNELRMSDLDCNNNNNENQPATTLFPEVTPVNTHQDPLPTDLFQSSLASSKLPISSTIVPGQPDGNQICIWVLLDHRVKSLF